MLKLKLGIISTAFGIVAKNRRKPSKGKSRVDRLLKAFMEPSTNRIVKTIDEIDVFFRATYPERDIASAISALNHDLERFKDEITRQTGKKISIRHVTAYEIKIEDP